MSDQRYQQSSNPSTFVWNADFTQRRDSVIFRVSADEPAPRLPLAICPAQFQAENRGVYRYVFTFAFVAEKIESRLVVGGPEVVESGKVLMPAFVS